MIPFIRTQTSLAGASTSISPLILATPANSVFSTSTGSTKALQASLAINGTGATQSSAIVVLVGNVVDSAANQAYLEGVIHGSYLGTATGQPTGINTYYQTPSDSNRNSFYGGNGISGFVLSPGATAPHAIETSTSSQTETANYQFAQAALPVTAPPVATAAPKNTFGTATNLSGWFGGIMTKEPVGGTGSPAPYVLAGTTMINTFPDLLITATLTGQNLATSMPNGTVLQFGSQSGVNSHARQAYINNNLFAVLESPDAARPTIVNGVSASPVNFAFPANSSSANTNPNIYLVTQTAAPPTSLLPKGLCSACQYLQWGYWGGEIDTPSSSGPACVDVGHINSWVAGIPTSASDITSLKAFNMPVNYAGNLFGTVQKGTAQYLATGGLTASYNFHSGAGTFTVSNYDASSNILPKSFTISGTAPLTTMMGSNSYTFGIPRASGLTGAISGSFYGPMAKETGGNFAFSKILGSPYFTSGIFAARQ